MRRVAAGAFHADTPFAAYMSCVTCVHHVCAAFAASTACCVSVLRMCRLCSPHMFTVVWWRAWSPAVQSVEVSAAVVVCCSCVVGSFGAVSGGGHGRRRRPSVVVLFLTASGSKHVRRNRLLAP